MKEKFLKLLDQDLWLEVTVDLGELSNHYFDFNVKGMWDLRDQDWSFHSIGIWINILECSIKGCIYFGLWTTNKLGFLIFPNGWMDLWIWMIDLAGRDAHVIFVFGNLFVLLLSYWIPATLFTLADVFKPQIIYQYKVQEEKSQVELNFAVMYKLVSNVLTKQLLQILIGSELAWIFRWKDINITWPLDQVPSVNM